MDYESQLIFVGDNVQFGKWRCGPDSSLWGEENIAGRLPMLVFPHTSVHIRQANHDYMVTSLNQVVYYNQHQTYYRGLNNPQGDICDYIYVSPFLLAEILRELGLPEPEDVNQPFEMDHGPCDSHSFKVQRALYRYLASEANPDPLLVEEAFLNTVPALLNAARGTTSSKKRLKPATVRTRRIQVESAKEFLANNFDKQFSISDVARTCDGSDFHICRIFKEQTGKSIFRYVSALRVREAFERIVDSEDDLTDIAMDTGFCSHSYMTQQFGKTFGVNPGDLRRIAQSGRIGQFKRLLCRIQA